MELRVIELDIDKANKIYASADCQQLIDVYKDHYPKIGFNPPWVGYFVVRDDQVVGCCGFVEPPKDGIVEIAYGTFKEFEGQGIASFSCKELMSIAYNTDPTATVTAKTAPEETPR
ncbi:MAG: GNAT family N-acetyltransferase [Pyrinomonadaceae bacterium]